MGLRFLRLGGLQWTQWKVSYYETVGAYGILIGETTFKRSYTVFKKKYQHAPNKVTLSNTISQRRRSWGVAPPPPNNFDNLKKS